MDAVVRRTFWNALLDLYVRDRPTIIISSHEVDDIEDLVEDVVVLQQGGLVAEMCIRDSSRPRPPALPQGQGLAARTSWKAAG